MYNWYNKGYFPRNQRKRKAGLSHVLELMYINTRMLELLIILVGKEHDRADTRTGFLHPAWTVGRFATSCLFAQNLTKIPVSGCVHNRVGDGIVAHRHRPVLIETILLFYTTNKQSGPITGISASA